MTTTIVIIWTTKATIILVENNVSFSVVDKNVLFFCWHVIAFLTSFVGRQEGHRIFRKPLISPQQWTVFLGRRPGTVAQREFTMENGQLKKGQACLSVCIYVCVFMSYTRIEASLQFMTLWWECWCSLVSLDVLHSLYIAALVVDLAGKWNWTWLSRRRLSVHIWHVQSQHISSGWLC